MHSLVHTSLDEGKGHRIFLQSKISRARRSWGMLHHFPWLIFMFMMEQIVCIFGMNRTHCETSTKYEFVNFLGVQIKVMKMLNSPLNVPGYSCVLL